MKITDLCDDILELIGQNAVDIIKKIKSKRKYDECLRNIKSMNPLYYSYVIPTDYDDEYFMSLIQCEVFDLWLYDRHKLKIFREIKKRKLKN